MFSEYGGGISGFVQKSRSFPAGIVVCFTSIQTVVMKNEVHTIKTRSSYGDNNSEL